MTEKNPISPEASARIGEELDKAVADLAATESDTNESAIGGGLSDFVDPLVAAGIQEESPLMMTNPEPEPEAFVEATAQMEGAQVNGDIQSRRSRLDAINKAAQEGKLGSLYGYGTNSDKKAEEEVARLEAEIRELEKTPIEAPVEKTIEAPDNLREMRERIDDLTEQLRQLREQFEATQARPNPEGDEIDISEPEPPEQIEPHVIEEEQEEPAVDISEPEPPEQIEPHVLEEESEPVVEENETAPAEQPIGMAGASAALESFRLSNEEELNRLRAERDGREAAAGTSLWERAKEKGARTMSFLRERVKGLATMGYWEVRQAEKVRKAGSGVGKIMESGMGQIQQESLNEEDINVIKNRLRESGNDVENMPEEELRSVYGWLESSIVTPKVEANQAIVDRLVTSSIQKIEEKLRGRLGTGGYHTFEGAATLENGYLPEAKRQEIEAKLRAALSAVRTTQIDRDIINYGKLVRGSIDPNWYKRYVAGGIEMALGAAALKWLILPWVKGKFLAGATKEGIKHATNSTGGVLDIPTDAGMPADAASELVGATPGAEEAMKPLRDNLWNMGRDLLKQQGITNPTDADIMKVTKQLAIDNNVSISKWGLNAGKWIDSAMPKGLPIKIGGALKVAGLAVRAARLATGV